MSKYIKVDDLQEFCDSQTDHSITPNDFQRMNRIEIIRCKDCKWCNEKGFCKHPDGGAGNIRPADWFCADGERK